MSLGQQIRDKRKRLNLSGEQLADLLKVTKDKIYKWENGTKPSNADELIRVKQWLGENLENVPQETEVAESDHQYVNNYRDKYIALLESENEKKSRIIDVSLSELMLGNRIFQAHLKALLQITVVETAVMQDKDPEEALMKANKVVAAAFSATDGKGS